MEKLSILFKTISLYSLLLKALIAPTARVSLFKTVTYAKFKIDSVSLSHLLILCRLCKQDMSVTILTGLTGSLKIPRGLTLGLRTYATAGLLAREKLRVKLEQFSAL